MSRPGAGSAAWRLAALSCAVVLASAAAPGRGAAADALDPRTEVNKQVTNPVPRVSSVKLKNEIQFLDRIGRSDVGEYKLEVQPVVSLPVTPAWRLIVRPQFTLLEDKPYAGSNGESLRTTGVGDTVLDLVAVPEDASWLLGIGPTFTFPTANLDETGQGKWQAGPGAVVGREGERWIAGAIVQQWWSFAGEAGRKDVSQMHLQYLASWFLRDGWGIGTSPTIKFDWEESSGNRVTFPLGLAVSKVVELGAGLPVKLELQGLYAPVRPDSYGEKFGIQIYVVPVIPSLLHRPLWGPR